MATGTATVAAGGYDHPEQLSLWETASRSGVNILVCLSVCVLMSCTVSHVSGILFAHAFSDHEIADLSVLRYFGQLILNGVTNILTWSLMCIPITLALSTKIRLVMYSALPTIIMLVLVIHSLVMILVYAVTRWNLTLLTTPPQMLLLGVGVVVTATVLAHTGTVPTFHLVFILATPMLAAFGSEFVVLPIARSLSDDNFHWLLILRVATISIMDVALVCMANMSLSPRVGVPPTSRPHITTAMFTIRNTVNQILAIQDTPGRAALSSALLAVQDIAFLAAEPALIRVSQRVVHRFKRARARIRRGKPVSPPRPPPRLPQPPSLRRALWERARAMLIDLMIRPTRTTHGRAEPICYAEHVTWLRLSVWLTTILTMAAVRISIDSVLGTGPTFALILVVIIQMTIVLVAALGSAAVIIFIIVLRIHRRIRLYSGNQHATRMLQYRLGVILAGDPARFVFKAVLARVLVGLATTALMCNHVIRHVS